MRRVWRKIKSNSGASILFAILIFMLCVLAGTAALTAAGANAGRYTHLEAEQQEYLSVASAVQLLKEEIVGMECNAQVTETTINTVSPTTTYSWGIEPAFGGSGDLLFLFNTFFKDYYTSRFIAWTGWDGSASYLTSSYMPTTDPPAKKLTMTVENNPDMGSVTVTLTADENYRITVEVYSGGDTDKRNLTTMIFTVTPDYSQDITTQTVTPTSGGAPYTVKHTTKSMTLKYIEENVSVYTGTVTA